MFIKNDNIVLRKIHGSFFLIDISDNYLEDKCSIFEINEIGKFIWDSMDEYNTIEELVSTLQNVIDDEIPYEELYFDVSEYMNDIVDKKFVLEVTSNG